VTDTLPGLLSARAEQYGRRAALIANDGTGVYRELAFTEFHELALAIGAGLAARIDPGRREIDQRRVCWIADTSSGLVPFLLYHAIAAIGGVSVPLNPGSSADDLRDVLERVDPALVVARSESFAGVTVSAPLLPVATVDDLLALVGTGERPRTPTPTPADPAVILFTSGTTGRSKGVVHTHASALAAGNGWSRAFALGPDDRYQSMYAPYAGAGLHFNGLACLLAGTTYIVDETRPTSASLARIEEYGSTIYAAVPSIYQYWLREERSAYHLDTLRLLNFGGAVMHRGLIEELRAYLPQVDLLQTYGLTEAGPGGLNLPPEFLDGKLGSIGSVAIEGLRFRVDPTVSADDPAPAGAQIGELQFTGASIMSGYLDDPAATAAVFDGEWLRTGDLVRVDDDGFVFFLDRLKDLIIRGGFNISSVEVEEALLGFEGVREVAAFPYPHESLGEVVAVAVVPHEGRAFDLAAFRGYAEQHLSRVKVPDYIAVLPALPISAAGKVLKTQLRTHPELKEWT
jgi:acyl-CoA synthetase (AMP-forming)/AMP-acid ligase II